MTKNIKTNTHIHAHAHTHTNVHAIQYNKNKSFKNLNKFHKLLARLAIGRRSSRVIRIRNGRKALISATADCRADLQTHRTVTSPTETTDCKELF